MVMDLTGNENFQLWYVPEFPLPDFLYKQIFVCRRYWEDADSEVAFPKIDGELDNRPGRGRFERVTNDNYSYHSVTISYSNRLQRTPFFFDLRPVLMRRVFPGYYCLRPPRRMGRTPWFTPPS